MFKIVIFLATMAAVLTSCAFISDTQQAAPAHLVQATVVIDLPDGHGAGVRVGDNLVLTNAHVVAGASLVAVENHNGSVTSARVLYVGDPDDNDIAVLEIINNRDTQPAATAPVRCDNPHIGDPVTTVGHPRAGRFVLSSGFVASTHKMVRDDKPRDYYLVDMAINPGNSGGAVFDRYGRVVGLATAFMGYGNPMFGLSGNTGIGIVTGPGVICSAILEAQRFLKETTPASS